jgi:hypothetical protein
MLGVKCNNVVKYIYFQAACHSVKGQIATIKAYLKIPSEELGGLDHFI